MVQSGSPAVAAAEQNQVSVSHHDLLGKPVFGVGETLCKLVFLLGVEAG
jgi:hypothetical protein